MKRVQTPEFIQPLLLAGMLLLSACRTPSTSSSADGMALAGQAAAGASTSSSNDGMAPAGQVAAGYVDQTKTLFPLDNYPQSVDQWLPSGPDKQLAVIDEKTQQRFFLRLNPIISAWGPKKNRPGIRIGSPPC